MDEQRDPLIVADAAAWRAWLDEREFTSDGVWLILAKKGTLSPTSLGYAQALEEALCSGWIDGQKKSVDSATFMQRFTPRRRASMWSQRNIGIVGQLIHAGRMRERGHAEITRAREDGRWDRAYAGAAAIEVPEDLLAALAASPRAAAAFAALGSSARYSILHPIVTAATAPTRAARIARARERLEG
ncbi:YdeI/OmpD-associated family protein [Mycetocola spongiae]|uniref:YdeI/OmpD-associated family protein n=1 Tax=Mycetocola spongiae TaxID=2859226 RepID=UPI001CF597D7|nr:YdeI/OmpD-associated family protein [Mycetocola spongiae]UCR89907.1 YdeI/OmpD-associated family protein [Mycetocola spongiae]